jgi:putative liporotein
VKLEIPCFDKKGDKIGDAVDTIDSLEKNKKWEFRAVLNSGDVKSCKVKDSYVSAE